VGSKGLTDATVKELVSTYVEAAAAQGRASAEGDDRTANAHHDRLADAYRELRARGREAQGAILALLDHPDPHVRSWAGAHALEFSPEDGERTLEELVDEGGLAGFNAEMTLATWRQGSLQFP
jgi:hypothetical protein